MKNLFDYAKKELSQDAFLRWLFESYEDIEINNVVIDLLENFCKLKKSERIQKIKTFSQWHCIDIRIEIITNERTIFLYIEDKTFSLEHNQLEVYNRYIENENAYKIYFKTAQLTCSEIMNVQKAQWEIYDINSLYDIFKKYVNTSNIILNQYIEHLYKLKTLFANKIKPLHSKNQDDWLMWGAYFKNVICPEIDNRFRYEIYYGGRYSYACLQIWVSGREDIPYMEIRSNQCTENCFGLKLLCYGIKNFSPQEKIIKKICKDGIFDCKIYRKEGKHPKQIGNVKNIAADTDEKFIRQMKIYLEYYFNLIKQWK